MNTRKIEDFMLDYCESHDCADCFFFEQITLNCQYDDFINALMDWLKRKATA